MRGRYSGFGALRFAYARSVFYSLTSSNPSTPQHTDTESVLTNLHSSLDRANRHLLAAQQKQAQYANTHRRHVCFNVGDRVWLSTEHLHLATTNFHKLQHGWREPFCIVMG